MNSSYASSQGMTYSAILHGGLLLLLFFGLPSFLHRHMDAEPTVISVDILPIAEMSNVKPQEKTPEKEEKKPEEKPETAKKATPEAAKEEATPEEVPLPVSAPKVVKPEKPKPKKEKPKKKEESLESILKAVKDEAKHDESKKPTEAKAKPDTHEATSQNYNPDVPLSMSETDAIRQQIQQNWLPPAGAKDAYKLIVYLHIEMREDGSVTKAELASDQQSLYDSDPFFRAAADAAIRAVERSSPLKNLPPEKYGTWRDMTFDFNPKELF